MLGLNKLTLQIYFLALIIVGNAYTEEKRIQLGFIGSLSSFAASYGTAVLEGAELAVKELNQNGIKVDLAVEDEQSVTKNAVNAFVKLATVNKVQGIIGGSWWLNSIVKQSENAKIPLISCETLYDQDTVLGKSYFIMQGDLREWVRVYKPFIVSRGYKRGAIVRYVSGFGATLASEMQNLFSEDGRTFAGAIEYNDIQMAEASSIVLRLKQMAADVVYVDAQPGGLVNLLKRIAENGMENITILTNSIAEDVVRGNMLDLTKFKNVYYTHRSTFDREFVEKFRKEYKKEPYLNADLGYYSAYLLVEALKTQDSIASLKSGISVAGKRFQFNENNVYSLAPQEIWKIDGTKLFKIAG